MIPIDGETAVIRISRIAGQYREKGMNARAEAAEECETAVRRLMDEERIQREEEATAERVCQVEPWFERGLTGRDVWRCGACGNRVDRGDAYCRTCGKKLVPKKRK